MLQKILDIFYPKRCAICDCVLDRKESKICHGCKKKVSLVSEPTCKHCGKPIEFIEDEFCYDCKGKDFYAKKGFAVWVYDKYMKQSISKFKYANRFEYADYYADELVYYLGSRLTELKINALIPVPIHKEKLRYRGFNQAGLLAEKISEKMKIPVLDHIMIRTKNTKPQKGLNDKERHQNIENAFSISRGGSKYCQNLHRVLLIDDIYTTGVTIEACARELVQSGVKEVYFVCLCIGKDY